MIVLYLALGWLGIGALWGIYVIVKMYWSWYQDGREPIVVPRTSILELDDEMVYENPYAVLVAMQRGRYTYQYKRIMPEDIAVQAVADMSDSKLFVLLWADWIITWPLWIKFFYIDNDAD